jgi:hypothetical protein
MVILLQETWHDAYFLDEPLLTPAACMSITICGMLCNCHQQMCKQASIFVPSLWQLPEPCQMLTVFCCVYLCVLLWLLQDVDSLPAAGQAVSPLKVKRATKGQGPSWLMATTYLTSSQAGERSNKASAAAAAAAAARFQPAQQQVELTREQQLADIEVRRWCIGL